MSSGGMSYHAAGAYLCEARGCSSTDKATVRIRSPRPVGVPAFMCVPHFVEYVNNGVIVLVGPDDPRVVPTDQPTMPVYVLAPGEGGPCTVDNHGKNTINTLDGAYICSGHLRERFGNPILIVDQKANVLTTAPADTSNFEVAWE